MAWFEPFSYAAGPLNGQGRWHDLGGFSGEWIETTGQVEIGPGNLDAGSTKSLKPFGINFNIPFSLFFVPTQTADATHQVLTNVTCGKPSTINTIIVRTIRDLDGTDQIAGSIDTPTQSASGILGGFTNGFAILWELQYDGADLILSAGGTEVCRITGASYPSIYPQITLEGQVGGTATCTVGSMQITQP